MPQMLSVFHVGNHPDTQPMSVARPQMAHGDAVLCVRMSWSGFSSGMGRGRLFMCVGLIGVRHRRRAPRRGWRCRHLGCLGVGGYCAPLGRQFPPLGHGLTRVALH